METEYKLLMEFMLVSNYHINGLYVMPSKNSAHIWNGFISVQYGCYANGMFPFKVTFPDDFPSTQCPKITLDKGFYHPDVDEETGELNLSHEYRIWCPRSNHAWQLLHHLNRILISPVHRKNGDVFEASNKQAAELLYGNRDLFDEKVKDCVENFSLWNDDLMGRYKSSLSGDDHDMNFDKWKNDNFIERVFDVLANNDEMNNEAKTKGYSWMDPDTMTIFASDVS